MTEAEALALEICKQLGRSPADPEAWAECLWDAQQQLACQHVWPDRTLEEAAESFICSQCGQTINYW